MKVLVLGSGGMLGHITTIHLKENGYDVQDVSYPEKAFNDSYVCNVFKLEELEVILNNYDFDIIINCIALLVEASEKNKAEAVFINSYFPHWLEKKYIDSHTKIIQVSTDGVFGNGTPPYAEDDRHLNDTFYAKSKSLGELVNSKDLTVRSSYFGPDKNVSGLGLLNWFFKQKGEISGFDGVFFTGVTSLEFAQFIEKYGFSMTGTYNLGARESISKFELLKKIKNEFNIDYLKINPNSTTTQDTSVHTKREDCKYQLKSYDDMISELHDFMNKHYDLYPHYNFIKKGTKC